jgi:hypothetical protein
MRNVAFLGAGLALLVLQANVFRATDGVRLGIAVAVWLVAVLFDVARAVRQLRMAPRHTRAVATFRADLSLPATVMLGYSLLVNSPTPTSGGPFPRWCCP